MANTRISHLPTFSAAQLLRTLKSLPDVNSYIVGFSGGADSSALLYALIELADQLDTPVSAVHINHGLHKDADRWQEHCLDFCRQYNVPLQCITVNPQKSGGKGLEAEARHLRYEAISALLETGDCLLTAHHCDDQTETVLLNLMRGSGIDGLSAIPDHRALGAGSLQRPLLGFQNSVLRRYLDDNNISWLEDPSNQSLNHDRNFMRHKVIPLLESRWPGLNQRLGLTRSAMAESRSLLEPLADAYLEQHQAHRLVLDLTAQIEQQPALFKLVVRRWLKKTGLPSMPARSLNSLYMQLCKSDNDQKIKIHWQTWSVHVYQHRLWLLADHQNPPCPDLIWPSGQHDLDLGEHIGKLIFKGSVPAEWPGELITSSRKDGKARVMKHARHHKSLKNLFQSAGIPAWLRDSIPLCIMDGDLVAVGDWKFSESFKSWLTQNKLEFSWQPASPLLQYIVAQQHAKIDDEKMGGGDG